MDRRRRQQVLLLIAIVGLLLGSALVYARPLLRTGTGYAAHNACAVQLVAGRDADAPAADLPDNPLVPVLSTSVDTTNRVARSSVLGLFSQQAWFTPGLGCTLADDRPDLPAPPEVTAAEQEEEGSEAADPVALEAALDRAFAEDDPQGRSVGTRAVVVLHEGSLVAERYAAGFDADTPQLGWSMAKSVTNAMVGRLVNEGDLDVGEAGLLEAWAEDERSAITVEHLLQMTSGLEWDEAYSLGSTITRMLYLEDDMGAFAAEQPLAHEPGAYQQYSSGTTNILCDVMDEQTGLGPALPYDLVFEPLGMTSAVMEPDAAGDPVCSSYLWATPRDWGRFGLWFAQDGVWEGQRLLPEGWVSWSTTVADVESEEEGFAAHWWVNRRADGSAIIAGAPDDMFWASGHDGQRVFVVPSADLVVVRMGFTPNIPSEELGYERWLPDLITAVTG